MDEPTVPKVKEKVRSKQDAWMHQYLTPGNYELIVVGGEGEIKRGKCAFIVPAMKTNMSGPRKMVPAMCIVDVMVHPDGSIVRKPNRGGAMSEAGAGKKMAAYQQLTVTLDLIPDVCAAMLRLAGTPEATKIEQECKEALREEAVSEEDKWIEENMKKAFGGMV